MPDAKGSIRFTARLHRPAEPKRATWTFVMVPEASSRKLPTRASTAVDGALDGHPFTAILEPDGAGAHWLKVPASLREAAGVSEGDTVSLDIRPAAKQPEPRVPADLRKALQAAPDALATWKDITPAARRDWILWITTAKQATTRSRRIGNACDMLAGGKRRVCCFDRTGIYGGNIRAPVPAG